MPRFGSMSRFLLSAPLLWNSVSGWREVTNTFAGPELRIVGGNAVDPQRYPYFVLIERTVNDDANNDPIQIQVCGGTLM
jgi:secreted trypsin-like serine protease